MTEPRLTHRFDRRALLLGAGALLGGSRLPQPALAHQQASNSYTFIVAGLDKREDYPNYNSDVLMVSRVDLDAGEVRTMAIPRDLYVEIPGVGFDKITSAFTYGFYNRGEVWEGGAQLLTETIELNFGLTIDAVATTTFVGFEQIIDAIGGVTVDNPYAVVGFRPGSVFPAGVQTLSGEEALVFVRTRKQDGDDGRVMRQQLVLGALLDHLQSPAVVGDLPQLVAATRNAVTTNIPNETILQLIAALPRIDRSNVQFATMTEYLVGGIIDSGAWVYQGDWSFLPGYVQGYLDGQ